MKRLRVMVAIVFVSACCFSIPIAVKARQGRPQHQMVGVPANQALLDSSGPPPMAIKSDKRALDARNQLEIRMSVQRLYALASELKDDVDQTDSNFVLSMSVVKRAQDIEKLAKEIKERVKK